MSQQDAEEAAVRRMGPTGPLARELGAFSLPLKALLGIASATTIAVALWLFSVIAFVLPSRDPDRIPLWTAVSLGFLLYSGLCIAYLLLGPRVRMLRALVVALSVAAIALGAYTVAQMVRASSTGGHFEGHLLLMGLILAGHGVVALASTAMSLMMARRIAAH